MRHDEVVDVFGKKHLVPIGKDDTADWKEEYCPMHGWVWVPPKSIAICPRCYRPLLGVR